MDELDEAKEKYYNIGKYFNSKMKLDRMYVKDVQEQYPEVFEALLNMEKEDNE